MKVIHKEPPNIKQIKKVFDLEGLHPVFTYGDKIYNPDGGMLPKHLLEHEHVHSVQQGKNPKSWWKKYLEDDDFRREQELEAYREQYRMFCMRNKDRNKQAKFLALIARDFSSRMYGSIISFQDALKQIK